MIRQGPPDFTEDVLSRIRQTVSQEADLSRRQLSIRVCEWLDWRNPQGGTRDMSCRVKLLDLHRRGLIELPVPRKKFDPAVLRRRSRESRAKPPEMALFTGDLKEIRDLEVVLIPPRERALLTIHTGLIESFHYLGTNGLCGPQLRYLVRCHLGWVGAFSFSAAALQCADRDKYIGWNTGQRRQNRSRVVNNSRFLIRPEVRVPNLASHLMGRVLGHLRKDWHERYGVEPVLVESFVEPEKFKGTCYLAANWRDVGATTGRGRQDKDRKGPRRVKRIVLYPLCKNFRTVLQQASPTAPKVRRVEDSLDGAWAEHEFGAVDLGDKRLNQRLILLANCFAGSPGEAISVACRSLAETKAAYRFIDNDKTDPASILAPHYEATAERCAAEPTVLTAQDTTYNNYTHHPATTGLGPIGHHKQSLQGLVMHNTLAFTPEGLPLGLIDIQCWKREKPKPEGKPSRKKRPITEKESIKWIESYRKSCALQARIPQTRVVSIGDSEADIYELFYIATQEATPASFVVRAYHDRLIADGDGRKLKEDVLQAEVFTHHIDLPRSGARPRPRRATLEVRFKQVHFHPQNRERVSLWAIHAWETSPPDGVDAIEWMLLTNVPTESREQALERLGWYCCRWGIEVFHRTLKSGCRIEDRQSQTADRLETCLAIDAVVAWRVMLLTMLGRMHPEAPSTSFFSEEECQALHAFFQKPLAGTPSIYETMMLVARLGGFLGRKSDGYPGCTVLWRGLEKLEIVVAAWKIFRPPDSS